VTELYSAHVELYDRAFGWDVSDEVDWLVARLGPECRSVLEPGCGTGRYLEAFELRGIDAFGFDRQPEMVEAASRRGTAVHADWARLVDRSPFEQTAVYDGELDERPRVELGSMGRLLWHELTRS
jgi:SAM-dependent methyltransferase